MPHFREILNQCRSQETGRTRDDGNRPSLAEQTPDAHRCVILEHGCVLTCRSVGQTRQNTEINARSTSLLSRAHANAIKSLLRFCNDILGKRSILERLDVIRQMLQYSVVD